jgi:hypothetical protein
MWWRALAGVGMTLEDVVKTRLCLAAADRVAKRGAGAAGRAFGTG